MGYQLKLFSFWVFLLLTLSFCHGKNMTVKLIGLMHCTDCIRHEFSNSETPLGINIFIRCKSWNRKTEAEGNGAVNREGKFNITLSAEIKNNGNSIGRCFAKLQSASSKPCPIHSAQTASMKLISIEENVTQAALNRQTLVNFSPGTCQSATFWPLPNFTFFHNSPPLPGQSMGYVPPPTQDLPPPEPPVPSPLPPEENLTPPPAPSQQPLVPSFPPILPRPAPKYGKPYPPPDHNFTTPSPTPAPTFHSPQIPPSVPPLSPQNPPAVPPSHEPIPAPSPMFPKPIPPPFSEKPLPNFQPPYSHQLPPPLAPKLKKPLRPPQSGPFLKQPLPSPPPIGTSIPPNHRNPSPIPRAPPVPQLPQIPTVPRKYFNSPKSDSQPPNPSHPTPS